MGEKQYEIIFTLTDWLRVRVLTKRGRVFQFLVQYEALIDDQLHVISRYDNAHGFIHQDTFDPDGKRQRRILSDYTAEYALNAAIEDFRTHWKQYRARYVERMR
jgi:hypothetical protein